MCFSTTTAPHIPSEYHKRAKSNLDQYSSIDRGDVKRKVLKACRWLHKPPGIHSYIAMRSAGFEYINKGDTARCESCKLELSGWTSGTKPFDIHKQQRPTCSYVTSMSPSKKMIITPTTALRPITSTSNNEEPPSKKLKIDTVATNLLLNTLVEAETLKQVRKRTFSHWPHRTTPSQAQMIEAGFFNCNVGDRVICIYCNLICQQWTPHTDDPSQVHIALSPKCIYVKAKLIRREPASILIVNETGIGAASGGHSSTANNLDQFRCNEFVHMAACNAIYSELPKRTASFATWPGENLPPVDDLVKAGFFYTGTKNIVTCFYCNGSLQNWGPNDNPTIEHARWFPHCAYAKQLCGDELYRKIQESKRDQQERARANETKEKHGSAGLANSNTTTNSRQLLIPDESTLSRLVAARLDLPISQSLLDKNFKLSIIKRCWEDQLRLKHDDFVTDSDLYMACCILQQQIERIDGKKENITVPSMAMGRIGERDQAGSSLKSRINVEVFTREQITAGSTLINSSHSSDVQMTTISSTEVPVQNYINNTSNLDPCGLCLMEEWYPALLSCHHTH